MKQQQKFSINKFFIIAVICLLAFSNAIGNDNQHISIITENLSKKLQNDLSKEGIKVNLTSVRESRISAEQISFEGDGICFVTEENNQLPLRFNAKFNTSKKTITDIEYDFVKAVPAFAPSSNEEILMQELMKQISKDYGTQNIVIAIDGYEDVSKLTGKNEFTGVGEVRIGDFSWNKIKFDIVLSPENKTASKLVYKVEK